MTTIKALEGRTVHQIQSGQVIVDLCSVVKELVENSLDAGATAIDIRFKNNGLDSIEVQDNGSALKHYTSKLTNYDDLTTLQTFGFRGEALSSLCALSDFHVLTARAEDAPKGTRLDFEISGKLKSTQVVAGQKGTTVVVENLFRNLPVRRRELEKNIKREYGKVLAVLQAYACISTQVKVSVSNTMTKGKKAVVFATKSNPSTRENIANVFGAKTIPALITMDLSFEMRQSGKPLSSEWTVRQDSENKQVRITGHVSRPVFGDGRQTPDRQMFFVNTRPCGLPQVAKIFNEVYKFYNLSQSPFIFANIILDTNAYDVNVSPDKRTILLHDQGPLLENLRSSLIDLFEKQDQTVPQTQRPLQKLPLFKQLTVQREISTARSTDEGKDGSEIADGVDEIASSGLKVLTEQPEFSDRGAQNSLIANFAGRDTTERPRALPLPPGPRNGTEKLSKDKQMLVRRLSRDGKTVPKPNEYNDPRDMTASNEFSDEHSIPVQDFNKRLAEQQVAVNDNEAGSSSSSQEEVEEEISTLISTPNKPSPGVVQSAFDRMRPQRTPTQTATVTIGDKTTTSVLGPTVSKRMKVIPSPTNSDSSITMASQRFSSSMSSFAAPGTQIEANKSLHRRPSRFEGLDMSYRAGDSRSGTPSGDSDGAASERLEQGQDQIQHTSSTEASDVENQMNAEESDEDYMDEDDKKAREDARVAALIRQAEEAAAVPSQDNINRANKLFRGGGKKEVTTQLIQLMEQSVQRIDTQLDRLKRHFQASVQNNTSSIPAAEPEIDSPEERLSLKVSKEDFAHMRIIGQFNLGFILAVRPSHSPSTSDELFIIDQHASDEKYNFERLEATTIVQNQRLVHPHPLDLTAVDEEIILENDPALVRNGFLVDIDTSGDAPVGQRCKLVSLPMSREVVFDTSDLEELITLLSKSAHSRPSKVRKMFAMRACRSSVMIGKSLNIKQMERLVRKMGEIDKPWNCPHGRPTMRHVLGLGDWWGWREGEEGSVNWRGWLSGRGAVGDQEMDMLDGEAGDVGEDEEDDGGEDGEEDEEEEEVEEATHDDIEEDENESAREPSKLSLLGRFGSRG